MRLWISDTGSIRIKAESDKEAQDLRSILPFHGYYNPKTARVTLRRAKEDSPASGMNSPTRSFREKENGVSFTPKGDHKPTLRNYRTFVNDYDLDDDTLKFVLPGQKRSPPPDVVREEKEKTEAFKNAVENFRNDLKKIVPTSELRAIVQKLNQLLSEDLSAEVKIENGRVAVYRMVRID